MIEMKDICFAYDQKPILKHFDLTVNKGDFVLIKGDNGCGKSTLLNIINALDFCDIGEYKFDGDIINEKNMKNSQFSKAIHQKMGYVFQNTDAQLFCSSVEEEVAFGPLQMGLDDIQVQKRVDDMIALLGIEHLKGRAPFHLSMGEKKKVAIASVLATNPKVLVLDEPMNFLDKKSRQWIFDTLCDLNKAGKTIIVVSHTNHFDDIATKIVEM